MLRLLTVALACVLAAPAARAADFTAALPAETESVFHLKIKSLAESALAKKYLVPQLRRAMETKPEVQAVLKALDIDPIEDIASVTAGIANPEDPAVVVIVNGNFDSRKLSAGMIALAAAEPNKVEAVQDGGATFYKLAIEGEGAIKEMYASVSTDDAIMLASSTGLLKAAIAKSKDASKSAVSSEITTLLKQVGSDSTFVMVSRNSKKGQALALPGLPPQQAAQAAAAMEKVDAMAMAFRIGEDVSMQMSADLDSEETARGVAEMAEGALPQAKQMAALFSLQRPGLKQPLVDLADSIKFTEKGKVVSLKFKTTTADIEKVVAEMNKPQAPRRPRN